MIIVGLGNPGIKYAKTKHNIGFMFIDRIAEVNKITFKLIKEFNALVGEYHYQQQKHYLVKPITFMNNSGMAIKKIIDYYKEIPENLIVVYDDLDLPLAQIRIRESGSSGGHNGIKSIISYLQCENFSRIRIGIGRSDEVVDYVLTKFKTDENKKIQEVITNAPNIIDDLINYGIKYIMNNYNG